MKKEVLLVTILVIIVSLSAVVYAAALTNPGHGVEEVGSGSSPYAPFRDWNALESGYEDQYSGPAALKSNIFWLAKTNAETIAAQNSSGDWCALQVHPSGIYMNCFNNASNMSLFNSYYWNGTNFTKNDTIKEGNNVVEKEVLIIGSGGGEKMFSITESGGNSVTTSTYSTPAGTGQTTTATSGTTTGTISVMGDTTTVTNTDSATGSSGGATISSGGSVGTTAADGTGEQGTVNVDGGGTVTVGGTDGAGTGNTGGEGVFGGIVDLSLSAGGIADLFTIVLSPTATGGEGVTTANGPTGPGDDSVTITQTGQSAATDDPEYTVIGSDSVSGANIFTWNGMGDDTGAGSSSFSSPNAGGDLFSVEANGITSTTTITADATNVELDGAADETDITSGALYHTGASAVQQPMMSVIATQTDLLPGVANPIFPNTNIILVTDTLLGVPGVVDCWISSQVIDEVLDTWTYTCSGLIGPGITGACPAPCFVSIKEVEITDGVV